MDHGQQFVLQCERDGAVVLLAGPELLGPGGQLDAVFLRCPGLYLLEKAGAGGKWHFEILLCLHPLFKVTLPGFEMIDVAHDGVAISADLGYREFAPPAVVSQRHHLCRLPGALSVFLPEQTSAHMVMPVTEDIRLHRDQVVHNSLDGKEATVYLWQYVFDDYPISSLVRLIH